MLQRRDYRATRCGRRRRQCSGIIWMARRSPRASTSSRRPARSVPPTMARRLGCCWSSSPGSRDPDGCTRSSFAVLRARLSAGTCIADRGAVWGKCCRSAPERTRLARCSITSSPRQGTRGCSRSSAGSTRGSSPRTRPAGASSATGGTGRWCTRGPDPVANYDGLRLRLALFERQMRYMATHYEVVPLDEIRDLPAGSRHRRSLAAITFDDGYANFYRHAYPILRRLGLPATVFVVTDFLVHGRPFWWDRLRAMIAATQRPSVRIDVDGIQQFPMATAQDQQTTLTDLSPRLLTLPPSRREALLAGLAVDLDVDDQTPAICGSLSADELREMARDGISVGSHGRSHDSFLHLSRDALLAELTESKRVLESVVGGPVTWLCYPHGEFSADAVEAAIRAGYRSAVTVIEGLHDPAADPYAVRRIGVNDHMTFAQFVVAASGLREMLKDLLRVRRQRRGEMRGQPTARIRGLG